MKQLSSEPKVWVMGQVESKEVKEVVKNYFPVLVEDHLKADLAIVVGGDGTILEEMYKNPLSLHQIPTLKVHYRKNANKSLGYTIDVNMNNLEQALQDIQAGNYYCEFVPLLKTYINSLHSQLTLYALNDVAIGNIRANCNILPKIMAGKTLLPTPKCTGVVISTPYGSPAWNLSLNGALVVENEPEVSNGFRYYHSTPNCMLVNLRESPLKPDHFLVDSTNTVTINVPREEITVAVDRRTVECNADTTVTMNYEDRYMVMVKTKNTQESLTQKLIRFNRYQFEQI